MARYAGGAHRLEAADAVFVPVLPIAARKLAIWCAAAAVPWGVIIGTVRLVVAALS